MDSLRSSDQLKPKVTIMTTTTQTVDRTDLEAKVKEVYRQVAQDPFGEFHFAMGRSLAEHLGYWPADLDRISLSESPRTS